MSEKTERRWGGVLLAIVFIIAVIFVGFSYKPAIPKCPSQACDFCTPRQGSQFNCCKYVGEKNETTIGVCNILEIITEKDNVTFYRTVGGG